jgi:photosystem II stability/assembly factor-like uncharacterized protein
MTEARFGDKSILLHPKAFPLVTTLMGPFTKLGNGSVLAVDESQALVSTDEGKTWSPRPLFDKPDKYRVRPERALLRTRDGTLILAFLNDKEMAFRWDQARGGPQPGCRLPAYVIRSTDEGQSWSEPQLIQEGYSGALRSMIQLRSGRIVLGSQDAVANPGRHVCFTLVSDDDGKSWKRSNTIDLGEYGGYGDHGGAIEPALAQLRDGRVWMLIRTPQGRFSEAFSEDEGLTWKEIHPSQIEASDAPAQLRRLQSGRLVLLWNRYLDPQKKTGRREQLSLAFSEDDGQHWTEPVVIAHDPANRGEPEGRHWLSYPYVYEHVPGELWITTMQGPLRIRVLEDDFCPRRPSEATYQAVKLPEAGIVLDGRLDEPAWSKARVEKHFVFPWKKESAPPTEFRAFCDESHFYFGFHVQDADIVVLDRLRDEEDAVLEDRVEMYFGRVDRMQEYYCMEIDSRGRAYDYAARYYRRFDPKWTLAGLEAKGTPVPDGYAVEGRVPLESLEKLMLPRLRPGTKVRFGIYRAEFSHDRSGRPVVQRESIHTRGRKLDGPPPIEEWISWIDPKTEEPDFHVPTSLGWLEVVE